LASRRRWQRIAQWRLNARVLIESAYRLARKQDDSL
jgi:hypothetical protein